MRGVSSLKTSCYLAPDEYLTTEHGMSIDFREQAGGRSGKTEGLLERQATLGKTRYEALRASNPLASLSLLRNLYKRYAPMIHRKGERMMDQSAITRC
ncbi:hypothetical protein ElyMa_005805100 [Elysia marginata]|uniref:Uncharacterized protein n=1 Tax=Elysia marginata TaxID=1093978 RepID=A0AAV4FWF2_9GAST|nr:hypothetical protein ElyMa_005805100 [Elysia marginata]